MNLICVYLAFIHFHRVKKVFLNAHCTIYSLYVISLLINKKSNLDTQIKEIIISFHQTPTLNYVLCLVGANEKLQIKLMKQT